MSKLIKPYGDKLNDGMVQLSFTLPVKADLAEEAAKSLALKMGLADPHTVYHKDIGEGFTFVVVYGKSTHSVDVSKLKITKVVEEWMGLDEVNEFAKKNFKRKIVVVGACIESDAHTVGIDAILNMKGFSGDYGFERYSAFKVYNMGAQVPCEELIKKAKEVNADVILISQIVTQQNIHLHNLTKLIDMIEAEELREKFLVIVGGPSINNKFAKELGYDAGFGRGTLPSHVATYLVKKVLSRIGKAKSKRKAVKKI
ncbi:MAG: hypothetical protein A2231_08290 [Candidatus Firestonebacteria bacterium RIFOXYA2_FULL_40_8]|nr:MAG: hypothetical protein A2231_08290 [Candidatus Firestonebacteria bacterium RIFOXYA2_FULL_40_8]